MIMPRFTTTVVPLLLALCSCAGSALAAGCAAGDFCTEVSAFTARLGDFRTSASGANRRLTATVSFQNKTGRPLTLGYVTGSGIAIDEHGNRYTVANGGSNAVRGIGGIQRNTFDARFTLQPGERSDARFELGWYAANNIAGVEFRLELAIREIDQVTGDQYRLGREHVLSFAGLRDGLSVASGLVSAAASGGSANATPAAAPASTDATFTDPCDGKPRCYATGPFVAEVVQLISGDMKGSNHAVRVNVRFRNVSNQPLILAYQTNSGTMLDNYGQKYTVDSRSNANVSGIGQSSRNKADPQFVLSPGEARTATFNYSRYVGKTAVGTVFGPDLVVEQLEILPSQQVRSVREYSVTFTNLTAGAMTGDAGDAANAVNAINEAGKQLSEGLKSLFKKK